jgi:hypothetical protein
VLINALVAGDPDPARRRQWTYGQLLAEAERAARVLRSRDRSGAYLISLSVGTAILGVLFFLTLFIQDVWGYSPLKGDSP